MRAAGFAIGIAWVLSVGPSDGAMRTARSRQRATQDAPRHATPPAGSSTLSVTVNPAGTVSIDGGPEMDSPVLRVRVAPGRHVVRVSNASHTATRATHVVVRQGQGFALIIDLDP